ncbi:hypothetical protein E0X81_12010 [Halomonas sp. GDM18]|nr:hypothetical protein E0X81_12010 [Halomonas sp. GDM18]
MYLSSSFIWSAITRYSGKIIAVITGVYLARCLGPEQLGMYSYTISWINILAIFAMAGLPQLLMRNIPIFKVDAEPDRISSILTWSNIYVGIVSIVVLISIYVYTSFSITYKENTYLLCFATVLIPLKGYFSRQVAVMNSFDRPIAAQFYSNLTQPLIVFLLIFLLVFVYDDLEPAQIIMIQAVSFVICLILGSFKIKKIFNHTSKYISEKSWLLTIAPLSVTYLVGTFNAEVGVIILGGNTNNTEVGIFKVCLLASLFLGISLQVINSIISPRVSALYKSNNFTAVQDLLIKSVNISFYATLPLISILFIWGSDIVELLFGDDYSGTENILRVLFVGVFFNIFFGSVGVVMNMSGHENYSLKIGLLYLVLNISLLFILTPQFGAFGAALANTISLIIWNAVMAFYVFKLTGLKTYVQLNMHKHH